MRPRAPGASVAHHGSTMEELARQIDAGELGTVRGEVLPLERGREAFEAKECRTLQSS